jgi:hypothetical protein
MDAADERNIMPEMDRRELLWHKSSYCNSSSCLEVARDGDRILVQGSTEGGPTLQFSLDEWKAFLAAAHDGEFDLI